MADPGNYGGCRRLCRGYDEQGKDPLKGALLGAAGGYGGATLMGAGGLLGAGTAAGVLPSALSGQRQLMLLAPITLVRHLLLQILFANAPMSTPGTVMGASQAAPAGIFSLLTAPIQLLQICILWHKYGNDSIVFV
jgi:hypothetical protein